MRNGRSQRGKTARPRGRAAGVAGTAPDGAASDPGTAPGGAPGDPGMAPGGAAGDPGMAPDGAAGDPGAALGITLGDPGAAPGITPGDPAGAERPKSVELRDARALRALAHPTRLKLVGLLRLQGPMTATQAARELGETPQRCTFHLGQLAKYGLVEEAGGGRGRERPWQATASSTSWPNVMTGPEAAAASRLLEGVVARQHFEAVMAWIGHKQEEPEEWQEAAQLNDAALYLTADELADLGGRVWALLDAFVERNERPELRPVGSRPVTFLNLAFPRIPPAATVEAVATRAHDEPEQPASPGAPAPTGAEQPASPGAPAPTGAEPQAEAAASPEPEATEA